MLYALLLLMIVAVIFLCFSVIFGDIEWVRRAQGHQGRRDRREGDRA